MDEKKQPYGEPAQKPETGHIPLPPPPGRTSIPPPPTPSPASVSSPLRLERSPVMDRESVRREILLHNGLRYVALAAAIALLLIPVSQVVLFLLEGWFVAPYFGTFDGETGEWYLSDASAVYYIAGFVEYFLMFAASLLLVGILKPGEEKLFSLLEKRPVRREDEENAAWQGRVEEHRRRKRAFLPEVLCLTPVILGGAYVMGVVASLLERVYNMFGLVSPPIFQSVPQDVTGWVFYGLMICVAAPVCEEMLFRGALLRLLKPYGAGFAVACQAILFAVFHGTVSQLPYTVLGGLLMGYLAVKYGGILPSMILHALNNGFSLLLDLTVPEEWWNDPFRGTLLNLSVYCVVIVAAIVVLALRAKKDKTLFRMGGESEADKRPGLSAFRLFFLHPAMLVYFCASASLMLMTMTMHW